MAIENDKEFEDKMAQLLRMYRAAREIWARTNASDQREVGKWVVAGGRVVDMITTLLAELEDYTGCAELRLVLTNLESVRRQREAGQEKA